MTRPNTPDPASGVAQPPLKRIPAQYSFRSVAFYDRHSGHLCGTFCQGRTLTSSPSASASRILAWAARDALGAARPHTVYLTGGATAADTPSREWWREPLQHGWQITSWRSDPWRVEYTRDGLTIELATAAPWFGAEHGARACYLAWVRLRASIKGRFDHAAELLTTPAATGADLFRRSLPMHRTPAGRWEGAVEYPPIPDELREIILSTAGQGRMECTAPADRQTAPALYVYDARWQYAACVAHLPIGPWQHDEDVPDLEPYRPGWYRVDARVPFDWQHNIGLIAVRSTIDGRRVWPHTPGMRLRDAWVSSAELDVAANVAGWEIAIKERWLAQPDRAPYADVSRHWRDALRALRTQAQTAADPDPLLAHAARHLLIDTVGYWWRPERRVAGVAAALADVPPDAGDVLATEDGGIEYTVPAPFGRLRAALYRPELAAMVWARSLARTNRRALMVPPRDLLWIRSDAVVTACEMPAWADQGRIGDWRIKASLATAIPALAELPIPRDETSYRAMWARAGSHGPAYRATGEQEHEAEGEGGAE